MCVLDHLNSLFGAWLDITFEWLRVAGQIREFYFNPRWDYSQYEARFGKGLSWEWLPWLGEDIKDR